MTGQEKAFELMEKAIRKSNADQVELLLKGHDHFLSRYANSQIHQNTVEENTILNVKAIKGKKIGVFSVNRFDDDSIDYALQKALEIAENQAEVPDFPGLPPKAEYEEVSNYFERTATINPEEKALVIKDMIDRAHGDRISLSGAFYTGVQEAAVANSNGLRAYTNGTLSNIAVTASAKETSGYASTSGRDVDEIDHTRLIEEALESAKDYGKTISLEPGEYPVVLEEYAIADLLIYLSWVAFSSESAADGKSFIIPHKGERLFGEHISIYDDGLNPETFTTPFDYEGVPKKRVDFIKKGTVTGQLTYNTYAAHKENTVPTGHGLGPREGLADSMATHIFMEPGRMTNRQLLEKMGDGLLVKRFHYLTSVHPLKTLVSGMTRDGVFKVENGKITARVKNMRFTNSIINALKHVKAMSAKRKKVWFREFSLNNPMSIVTPRVFIDKFNFTGQTEFS